MPNKNIFADIFPPVAMIIIVSIPIWLVGLIVLVMFILVVVVMMFISNCFGIDQHDKKYSKYDIILHDLFLGQLTVID